ncbi:type II toxin-antitoxin system antitoxin DNA ADP-ribosyl glycohydrolase DarG [Spirosoma oryzicola]|uniref:type II toxin-antitoxin system antitoxin DNA ADP-ribosyl glycohydrolase DarG n=1 Tax=Spirosoma oryzicola TaxID=2898794 RepID=UPI001E6490C2|nr:macro domain-containing protein [Spirosoma oryzicola]UHG92553.1 macro domain-containing protein [Spirosoma oryzicola]
MIKFAHDNLLKSEAEALINTVNTVGVMGKGIALQFREKYPLNYELYRKACQNKEVQVGRMFVTRTERIGHPTYIINFPTKVHWKGSSQLEYIVRGLDDLVRVINEYGIKSVAVPPLGCGYGGLDWNVVKPLLIEKLGELDADVFLYEPGLNPKEAPAPEVSRELTKARALILTLINRYTILGYDVTHIEVQKLAYFLQEFGQTDLRLKYQQGTYGPYAYNLQHLLSRLEGAYLQGDIRVADSRPHDTLSLFKDKNEEIKAYLVNNTSQAEKQRLNTVTQLIEGFESPFGLELLATVHWALKQINKPATSIESVIDFIHNWSTRKKDIMTPSLVQMAYERVLCFTTFNRITA